MVQSIIPINDGEPREWPQEPAAIYLSSLSPGESQKTGVHMLNQAARLAGASDLYDDKGRVCTWMAMDWRKISYKVTMAVFTKSTGAPSSRCLLLSMLKGVAAEAWRRKYIDSEELARIRDIKSDHGSREPAGRYVEDKEINALIRVCDKDKSPAGVRDKAIITTCVLTGCRRADLANLLYERITFTAEMAEAKVIGKRNKERTMYIDGVALRALNAWLVLRGNTPGAVFWAVQKGGRIDTDNSLTVTALHEILVKRCIEAELYKIVDVEIKAVAEPTLSWHDFRRTFISNLLEDGEDISTVSRLVGHSDVKTTARYDRRKDEVLRRATRRISSRYI